MDGGSSTTLTNMGIASLPSAEISDDGGHGGDAFLPAVSVDSDGSTVDGGFSLSGKVSRSNASSYCRVVQPSENSGNAIFFENAEDPGTSEGAKRSGKLFECPFCHREFKSNYVFKVHVKSHTQKPYQCMICGRAFAQKSNARKHIERHKVFPHLIGQPRATTGSDRAASLVQLMNDQLDIDPTVSHLDGCKNAEPAQMAYRCPYCNELLDCYRCMKKHTSSHKDRKVFQCSVGNCREAFSKLEDFLAHLPSHGSRLSYKCPICTKTFDTLSDIGLHQCAHVILNERRPLSKKSYRCVECGDVFKSVESLEKHYAQTSHEYRCTRCKRVYCSSRRLRRHLKSHQPSSKYICNVCTKSYTYAYTLKCHMKVAHGPSNTTFACQQCAKTFNRRDVLRRHEISVHSPASLFRCTYQGCDKAFKRQDRLKEHVSTHGDVKKHRCGCCGQSFIRLQAYKMHMRSVHEKAFKFHCDSCQKGFNRPDKLRIHSSRCVTTKQPKKDAIIG